MSTLASRYKYVAENVRLVAENAGKNPTNITLIAVSKTWSVETLLTAYQAGVRHFGENRAEELAYKRTTLATELGVDNGITWHFIGNPQSRKTADIADHADLFHALDRVKIARRLSQRLAENGRILPVLLEVNVSGEVSKAGLSCTNWENDPIQREGLLDFVGEIAGIPHLPINGLMTMAPWGAPKADVTTVFNRTHALAAWLKTKFPDINWSTLSMGMTDDYPLAIAAGATHVRVGRAIFGSRIK
jgi:pyridoxal phosphate enzyme (YggS family)